MSMRNHRDCKTASQAPPKAEPPPPKLEDDELPPKPPKLLLLLLLPKFPKLLPPNEKELLLPTIEVRGVKEASRLEKLEERREYERLGFEQRKASDKQKGLQGSRKTQAAKQDDARWERAEKCAEQADERGQG